MRNLQRDDLELYRQSGHIVLEGRLARRPAYVVITPYAQKRMLQREIEEHEILDTLATPQSGHLQGKEEGRHEVVGDLVRGTIRIVYEQPAADIVLIVTTYPEFC